MTTRKPSKPSKLVVASLAYFVEAESEDQAESILLDFLTNHLAWDTSCQVLKLWVSARQDEASRVQDLKHKEEEALHD